MQFFDGLDVGSTAQRRVDAGGHCDVLVFAGGRSLVRSSDFLGLSARGHQVELADGKVKHEVVDDCEHQALHDEHVRFCCQRPA